MRRKPLIFFSQWQLGLPLQLDLGGCSSSSTAWGALDKKI